ncbi:MAG: lysylphosphatidylglycerol synthase transmembrane domain-containing protein [Leadbetterella sp.]
MLQKLKYLLIFCAVVTCGWFLWNTDWNQVHAALSKIRWKFLFLIVTTGLSSIFGTWAWWFCLKEETNKISFKDLFITRHLGETIGILNPTGIVGGEAFKVTLLKKYDIDQQKALSSIFISRILTMLTQVFVFIGSVLLLYYTKISKFISSNMIAVIITFCCFLVVYFLFKILKFESSWFKISFKNQFLNKVINEWLIQKGLFVEALKKRKKVMFLASICLIIHWCFGGFEFYLILHFLEIPISVVESVFIDMGVMYFKVIGSIIPGQVGIEEYGNKVTLQIIGAYSASVWIATSILRRSRQLFWIAVGFVMYLIFKNPFRKTPQFNLN